MFSPAQASDRWKVVLLPFAFDKTDDGSHDVSHIARVWANARAIHAEEGGDGLCLAAATI